MTSSEILNPSIVLFHPAAELYATEISNRCPQVRVVVVSDVDLLAREIRHADALVATRFPLDIIGKAKKLRWFQCTSAGVDFIMPIRREMRHIAVTNASGIHGDIISDYVMAGVTMLHWDFPRYLHDQAERKWMPRFVCPLADMTLGIVGLGAIGTVIARRAKSAGMSVFGTKRDVSTSIECVDQLFRPNALEEMLPVCDFVVLALPATPDTIGLIGEAQLRAMKRDAILVNIARGSLIVEADLIAALQNKTIAGAMLDVFESEPLLSDSPLWAMPNVIVTPHVAGNSKDYAERVLSILLDNVARFINGRRLNNLVDLERGY